MQLVNLSDFIIVDFSVIPDVMEDQGLEIVQRKQTIRNQDIKPVFDL